MPPRPGEGARRRAAKMSKTEVEGRMHQFTPVCARDDTTHIHTHTNPPPCLQQPVRSAPSPLPAFNNLQPSKPSPHANHPHHPLTSHHTTFGSNSVAPPTGFEGFESFGGGQPNSDDGGRDPDDDPDTSTPLLPPPPPPASPCGPAGARLSAWVLLPMRTGRTMRPRSGGAGSSSPRFPGRGGGPSVTSSPALAVKMVGASPGRMA